MKAVVFHGIGDIRQALQRAVDALVKAGTLSTLGRAA